MLLPHLEPFKQYSSVRPLDVVYNSDYNSNILRKDKKLQNLIDIRESEFKKLRKDIEDLRKDP
jgi:hypothetical protein